MLIKASPRQQSESSTHKWLRMSLCTTVLSVPTYMVWAIHTAQEVEPIQKGTHNDSMAVHIQAPRQFTLLFDPN